MDANMTVRTLLLLTGLFILAGCVDTPTRPVIRGDGLNWRCFKDRDLVQLTAELLSDKQGVGEVTVGTISHQAKFRIEGFDRRWDFGLSDDFTSYEFAFVIAPSGAGGYYDFTLAEDGEPTKPKRVYECVSP